MNSRRSTRALLVAFSVIGAGLIHLAAIRSHLGSPMAIASFTGIGMIQILLGTSLLQPGGLRLKRLAAVGVGGMAVGAWLISRSWGLPAVSGHAGPEPYGPADLAAVALQVLSIVLILAPERATPSQPRRVSRAVMTLPVVAVSALASFSLLSVPSHGHDAPVEVSTAAQPSAPALTKRAVPIPATRQAVPATTGPTGPREPADHAKAPAHSH